MTPERYQQIGRLYHSALELEPEKRPAFLAAACVGDEALLREVESLIASHEQARSFIESPAIEAAAELLVEDSCSALVGRQLGHYEIKAMLGAGRMGEVYLAQDSRLKRRVALKVLPADVTNNRERLHRFEQEARAASALNQPNIITIHEIGSCGGIHFIATELIEGETLRQKLQRARIEIADSLHIATQIAAALDAAHAAGIVHRDIKPENIMLRADGLVKVLDFGLAKLTEKETVDSEAVTRAQVKTQAGMVLGTVAYMSPEQARGQEVDARTDIWSFGVVLYEMLAGRLPFAGETANDNIASILKSEPQPLSLSTSDVPKELEKIVGKTLRKKRDERYQHIKDLLIDLRDLKQDLEFEAKLGRSTAPPKAKADEAVAVTKAQNVQTISSGGYLTGGIKNHKLAAIVALLVLTFGIAALYYFTRGNVSNQQTSNAPIDSIAVLPFANAAQDPNAEYLSDGITESLINRLSLLSNLKVMSSNSVFRYKGQQQDAQKVGSELNVSAVLTGSVKQIGDQLVINVSLDDARDNHHIWGEQYVRKFVDVLAVQSEIAQEVSTNLRLKLTGADERQLAKRYTDNPEAYQLYLKGMYEWKKHTQEDLQKAIEYFNQALEIDPNYALAYFGLAASYGVLGNAYLPPNENMPKSKAYAAKALALDDSLSEAHVAVGAAKLLYDWDWAEAEKEFKRAQTLNPNTADAHGMYATYFEAMGRFDEAMAEAKRAQDLEPMTAWFNMEIGIILYYEHHYDEAIAQLEKTINLEPRFVDTYQYLGQAYEQKKMYAQAIATYQKGMTQAERHPFLIAALGHAYALAGERDNALKALDELREMSKSRYISPYLFAVVYAGLGDKEQAFAWLNKALQDRSFYLVWLKVEPQFDSLHSDPRFQDLLRRIGLMPSSA